MKNITEIFMSIVIAVFIFHILITVAYKSGQADALKGKFKYKLVSDGSDTLVCRIK